MEHELEKEYLYPNIDIYRKLFFIEAWMRRICYAACMNKGTRYLIQPDK